MKNDRTMKSNSVQTGKTTVGIGLIYVILLGVFNLLVFSIFKNRTNVFWLSYAFMTAAFAVQIVVCCCPSKPPRYRPHSSASRWHPSLYFICVRRWPWARFS